MAAAATAGDDIQSSYIVHVAPGHAPRSKSRRRLLADAYPSFLRDSLPTHMLQPEPRVFYSYAHAAAGFAARLTRRQAKHLASLPSVLAVVPDGDLRLQTTRTPEFLRLSESSGLLRASRGALRTVISVIDSGVYPKDRARRSTLPSSATASLWEPKRPLLSTKGTTGDGHGTHTASTAAGSAVEDASLFNYGKGRAVGVAPSTRIAVYKACWTETGCKESDVLSAFDEAIADGVNVISISIGGGEGPRAPEFHNDTIATAAFNAVRKGIIVSAAAGNEGPGDSTLQNVAPWLLTVGASTIDRRFLANVVLGNGETITGVSLYTGAPLIASQIPLVDGGSCRDGKLDASKVAGKIVLCGPNDYPGHTWKGDVVRRASGVGVIIGGTVKYGRDILPAHHIIPATSISVYGYMKIQSYMASQQGSATATIVFQGTVYDQETSSAPRVSSFSSRGPNIRAPGILKPDVIAPGESILAAWTGEASPTGLDDDTRRPQFNIIYGTSMACPHVSGIVAMLREAQPTWSAAAIKSALMTTAYNMDNAGDVIKDATTRKASTPFARGAGHVGPNRALDPGLVYDVRNSEYISLLCSLGYTAEQIALFTRDGSVTDCSTSTSKADVTDLNYPAFSVAFKSDNDKVTQRRRLTNVGKDSTTTYTASVTSPDGVRVTVNPPRLHFMRGPRNKRYEVAFEAHGEEVKDKYTFGSITWSDGTYTVTSPITITWPDGCAWLMSGNPIANGIIIPELVNRNQSMEMPSLFGCSPIMESEEHRFLVCGGEINSLVRAALSPTTIRTRRASSPVARLHPWDPVAFSQATPPAPTKLALAAAPTLISVSSAAASIQSFISSMTSIPSSVKGVLTF
ncbi:hypothetical protein EJB05_12682, partial [Eragrostis curvula]